MKEPSPHSSRLALAGGLAAAIIVGGAGFLLGRSTVEQERVTAAAPVEAPPPVSVPPPALPALLGRADLIKIAADASDALASGRGADSALEQIDGKRFEIRLPFGCEGPADEKSTRSMRWRYDEAATALRLHVAPVTWPPGDWDIGEKNPAVEAPEIESIEGFWIDQPWTTSENCPAVTINPVPNTEPDNVDAMPPVEQSLAIGQVFQPEGGTRADQRKGKPYSNVLRVAPEALDTSQGFRLRLTGRIIRLPTGEVVHCRQAAGAGQRPTCLVGAQFDEVAIENPVTGKILATWRVGRR